MVCSFTWVLYERGELQRYFEGDDLPGYALYTATWGLIVPHLSEAFPGNRKMGVQVLSAKVSVWQGHAFSTVMLWSACCAARVLVVGLAKLVLHVAVYSVA